jgi:Gpi18-like mannosyltransferase
MDAWIAWTYRLNELGFLNFYSTSFWTNYTPGYLYILFLLGLINTLFSLSQQSLELLIKGTSILFEILLVCFIYFKSPAQIKVNQKLLLCSLLLFNPGLIFNSTIWGQIDGVLTFFMFISVYYLVEQKYTNSSFSYAFAFLIKPQSIAVGPLYLIELIRNKFRKKSIKLILPGAILFLLLSIPFFPKDPILGIFKLVLQMSNDYPATSLFAYNLWGIVGFWIDDLQKANFIIDYRTIGTVFFATGILFSIYLGVKKNANYFLIASLCTLFFYFLPTRVHERYLYPAIPFLFYAAFLFHNKVLIWLTVILSTTYALNLYYVYVYYNELFNEGSVRILYQEPLYPLLDQQGKLLSLFSTLIFSMIVFVIIKIIYAKKPNHK